MGNPLPLRLAVCGGGALAVVLLQALRAVARRAIDVTIFEPRARLGTGIAYSTTCLEHLLNTRAGNMSLTEDRNDFLDWLRTERPRKVLNWSADDFAPRALFAEYVQARLPDIVAAPNLRVRWVRSTVDSLIPATDGWQVVPATGAPVRADVVVLATGNELPRPLGAALSPAARSLIVEDPWDAEQKSRIPPDAAVLLVGTGLTAVDVVIELLHRGHKGPIHAVSRRGLLPRSHGSSAPSQEGLIQALPSSVRDIVRYIRGLCTDDPRGDKWRRAFVELRSMAPAIWRSWSNTERRRFLRHMRPYWDVHRHRLPTQVHRRIERALTSGRLKIWRGRIADMQISPAGGNLQVTVRQRNDSRTLEFARIINCKGPELDPALSTNPLLQALLIDGIAKPDRLGLGLSVDAKSRVIAADGSPHRTLYALGALTKGAHWEVVALPEIREQARGFARHLLRSELGENAANAARIGFHAVQGCDQRIARAPAGR